MKKKSIVFYLLLISSYTLIAQQTNATLRTNTDFFNNSRNSSIDIEKTEGTQYLSQDFLKATILPLEDEFLVKYNAFDDLIEVKQGSNILILDKKVTFYKIKTNTETYKSFKVNSKKENEYKYLIFCSNNQKVNLLKSKSKRYIKAKKASTSYDVDKPARFDNNIKELFYISLTDDTAKEFDSKLKSLIALFPENKNDIKAYVKSNKISLKKEKGLIKTINYIDSLLKK